MSIQIGPEALSILVKIDQFLGERQIEAYLVGGFVRDTLIGRSTADIDVAVAGDALKVASEMADALGGKFVLLDEANRIARVVLYPDIRFSTGYTMVSWTSQPYPGIFNKIWNGVISL